MGGAKDSEVNKVGMAPVFQKLVYSKEKTDMKQIVI